MGPARSSLPARVTLLAGLAFGSNGLTLGIISFALPGLRESWGLTPAQAAALVVASGTGQLVGGFTIGYVADRMGRRLSYAATAALSGLSIGAAALAPSLPVLAILLFLAGVGFGGVAPVATSLVGEFAPRSARGALMGWTQVIWVLGWIVAALGSVYLAHGIAWRTVFSIGVLPVILAFAGLRLVPESVRYLLAHGRRLEAEALAESLADQFGARPELPEQERAGRASLRAHLGELWSPRFRRRSIMVCTVWFVMIAAYNGPVILLPTVLAAAGFPNASEVALFISVVMVLPVIAATMLIDRVGRKPVMIASLSVGAAGAAGVAMARGEVSLVLAAIALAGGVLAAWPVILSYAAELYPTRIRATAIGWASAVGRTGTILSPALFGLLLKSWTSGLSVALSVFAGALVIAALIVALLGEETAGRSLEEVAEAV